MNAGKFINFHMAFYLTLVWLGARFGWAFGLGIGGKAVAIFTAIVVAILFVILIKWIAKLFGHSPW